MCINALLLPNLPANTHTHTPNTIVRVRWRVCLAFFLYFYLYIRLCAQTDPLYFCAVHVLFCWLVPPARDRLEFSREPCARLLADD
jgi:hypothetical protein